MPFALLLATLLDARGIILAGEPVRLDVNDEVVFTERQLTETAAATRDGLVIWAHTARGRELIRHFTDGEYRIFVTEDVHEEGEGRAPQPGIATLLAANEPKVLKVYEVILNPAPRNLPTRGVTLLPGQPATTADFMAVAWGAEMLHVWFYSRGILLPHHSRDDFQEQWRTIASQLGFPRLTHGDEGDDSGARRRRGTWRG
jgi:hypothetical protein